MDLGKKKMQETFAKRFLPESLWKLSVAVWIIFAFFFFLVSLSPFGALYFLCVDQNCGCQAFGD
jgi:hypothetical protein